jgi:endonuclease/exonuclease/phosphatase family metal-dependent hydrolase
VLDALRVRVLCWNLFHGRAAPAAGRSLLPEFASLMAGWSWDLALLQEVPPWWVAELARACDADARAALTSRNAGLALRRRVADRWPDVAKSNGGGANAILTRTQPIADHLTRRLRLWPERRVLQLARLERPGDGDGGTWVANLHASTDRARARAEVIRAWETALARARVNVTAATGAGPPPAQRLVFGGDLNLFDPPVPDHLGVVHAAASAVDHVFGLGFRVAGVPVQPTTRLRREGRTLRISDHDAVIASLAPAEGGARRNADAR